MTIEIALSLLAAAIPSAAVIMRCAPGVRPVDFTRLESEFALFRDQVLNQLAKIETRLEEK